MIENNITYPSTFNDGLNKIVKEYLELRYHEFNNVIVQIHNENQGHFSSEYQFHQFNNLSSINLFITYGYQKEQNIKECVSFHSLNDFLISIDDLIFPKEIKKLLDNNIENLDYNNFYLSKDGIHFIYIMENKSIEKLIKYENLNFKINP